MSNKIKLSGIFSGGYGIIPKNLMKADIDRNIKILLAYMLSYTGAGNECFPSISTIAKDLKMSKTTVIKYIKKAEELNYISRKELYPNNPLNHSKKYIMNFLDSTLYSTIDGTNLEHSKVQDLELLINNNNINNNNKESDKSLYSLLKEVYNDFLIDMKYSQEHINRFIFGEEKQRKQLAILLKKFNNKTEFEIFLKLAESEDFIKKNNYLPSILSNQYSNIMMKMKEEKEKPLNFKIPEKQDSL